MNRHTYCVIMAGGIGSRFWPLSRQSRPKQFLDILGLGRTFLQMTHERFAPLIPVENFLVVTNARYKALVLEQLPMLREDQVLCEPIGRNTAPAIAYAAEVLYARDKEARMIVSPADHLILEPEKFRAIVAECLDFVEGRDALMTLGIRPTRPETGYGYIQTSNADAISKVKCFTEKPTRELAEMFVSTGEFLWNSGIFVWKAAAILEAIHAHLPEHAALFAAARAELDNPKVIEHVFSECRSISIDYGVMEKADNVYVRTGDFGWSDIGTWGSLYQYASKDAQGNVKPAKGCYTEGTANSLIHIPAGKVAVVRGLKEYIVVDTADALLICPCSEEQDIKKFMDEVKYNDGEKYL